MTYPEKLVVLSRRVSHAVPHDRVVPVGASIVREIDDRALARCIVLSSAGKHFSARDHTIADGLDYIATWQTGMFSGPQMAEAFKAKREKREGVFPDLLPVRRQM